MHEYFHTDRHHTVPSAVYVTGHSLYCVHLSNNITQCEQRPTLPTLGHDTVHYLNAREYIAVHTRGQRDHFYPSISRCLFMCIVVRNCY